jgi:hypothetical protein
LGKNQLFQRLSNFSIIKLSREILCESIQK